MRIRGGWCGRHGWGTSLSWRYPSDKDFASTLFALGYRPFLRNFIVSKGVIRVACWTNDVHASSLRPVKSRLSIAWAGAFQPILKCLPVRTSHEIFIYVYRTVAALT